MSASVLVTLKVEVAVGAWNESATFESLREQVIREAKQKLQNALQKHSSIAMIGEAVAVKIVLNGTTK